jgi:hypothetical protein
VVLVMCGMSLFGLGEPEGLMTNGQEAIPTKESKLNNVLRRMESKVGPHACSQRQSLVIFDMVHVDGPKWNVRRGRRT